MQMDTTKDSLKARVLKARADWPKGSKVDQFKLAVFRFIAESLGIKDDKLKAEAFKQFLATNGSFGSNLSGFEQVTGLREAKSEVKVEEFLGTI